MKDYENYNMEDFLNEEDFLNWAVLGKSDEDWEKVLLLFPSKKADIENAKAIILEFKNQPSELSNARLHRDILRIMESSTKIKQPSFFLAPIYRHKRWLGAAAAIVLMLLSWTVWKTISPSDLYSYETLVEKSDAHLKEILNNNTSPLKVILPDRSNVILAIGSKISYSNNFTRDSLRNVILEGNAIFDVTKDSKHPFFVFSNGITIRVVGTSFSITSINNEISVAVKSGKVSVFKMAGNEKGKNDDILLLPNQKAIYTITQNELKKSIVRNPIILYNESVNKFKFDNAKASDVFKVLKEAYGIEIQFNEEDFKNCFVTIPFKNEDFFTKLNIICQTIGAKYEIVDEKVTVFGTGCN